MVVQHNLASMNANRQLNINNKKKAASSEKLSSGYRINRAADDAAGLSISEKMRYQIRGLNRASDNISDGISLIEVADGALQESHAILQRMNELAVQAANDTNTSVDRSAIQSEITQLKEELTRIATSTTFNGSIYPLNGEGWELPKAVGETQFTVVNASTSSTVTCDGVTYPPGASFTVKNVLSILKAPNYNSLECGAIYATTPRSGSGYSHSPIFVLNGESPSGNWDVTYHTLSDLNTDENGYLYTSILPNNTGRHYLCQRQWLNVNPPTVSNLEAQGALKATLKGEPIKIQSGFLEGETIEIPLVDATAKKLGVSSLDVTSHTSAGDAITKISDAIATVSEYRSQFGALCNRLEHAKANVDNTAENTQDAESRLRDTDMAEEMVAFSAASIVTEASQSMLSQANSLPQQVLSLLQ